MRAEANIRAGRSADAIADINIVRARAAKPGQDNTLNATELAAYNASPIDFLLDEREPTVFLARITRFNSGAAPNVKAFHILRPIPQTQIDRTEGGAEAFPQNPGY